MIAKVDDPVTETTSTERVTFPSGSETLVGRVFRPAAPPDGTAYPAVVVTGSWTTVKEQMASRYARALAERGYLTLAFDFRGYGESSGEPRDFESPQRKIEDVHSAVSFLQGRADVRDGGIGALGVCAGAGYVAVNAARDTRIRSLALVAPWLHNASLVRGIYGGDDGVRERVTAGEAASRKYGQTGTVDYVPAVSTTDPAAAMYGPFDYYLDPGRGAITEWPNRFAVMAWPEWLRFDPIAEAPRIGVPTLLVPGQDGAVPDGARQFYELLSAPKTNFWLPGTQFDFYDSQQHVDSALDLAEKHFSGTTSVCST
jgi:fermentation-respiration switch protein FrsA (DUF1100 family)